MGQSSSEIRQDIDDTRQRMGDTVQALSRKTDVKGRLAHRISETRDALLGRKDQLVGSAMSSAPSTYEMKSTAQSAGNTARNNPLGLAIGSIAVGLLVGTLIPSTRIEDEKLGPAADEVKTSMGQTAQQALEHGKQVAADVSQTAAETAQASGQQHAQQMTDEMQTQAKGTASTVQQKVKSGSTT